MLYGIRGSVVVFHLRGLLGSSTRASSQLAVQLLVPCESLGSFSQLMMHGGGGERERDRETELE